jgi:glycosyltransferase involved in cell wall biosynthesis
MVVTDSPEIYATCNNLRIVEFANVGNEVVVDCEADFELPYFGAPNFLFNAAETEGILPQSEDQLNRRRYSVCFAGNCDPSQYLSSKELDRLGVMSRVRAKEIIQNAFAPITLNIEKWSDKEKLTLPHTQSIVLSNSYKAGLNFTEYRRLLLKSNFFLALPGLSSPYTHSLYESLSCQCVPILPRSNLTAAGWVHGKNCLLFHDPKSLIECMRIALAADESSIRELRKNAAALFREKYDIETTASRLINSERSRIAFRNV